MIIPSRSIITVFFILWCVLWLNFIGRDLAKGHKAAEYAGLLSRDDEGKRKIVYGSELYDYLVFVRNNIPPGASYEMVGLEGDSLEYRRAAYYLYPLLPATNADYVLVYHTTTYARPGYARTAMLNEADYILRKQ
ncbi:MAG: hypothetical protein PHS37_01750 [Candidatus Omnitrophica bacterium]|nr:hypothetical protein [Candidatus Omnitrophota bacterium]